jgi:phytoene dehydrogenase-like protein
MSTKDVAIVGAGLAGLHCALCLLKAGLEVVVIEASDAPGGRIRTDHVDGFLLDRGFQVLLTAYPEAVQVLDYAALDLHAFKPGALVWRNGRFHRFADPFRDPIAALRLAVDPVVTIGDKLRVAKLRAGVQVGSIAKLFAYPESTTRHFLQNYGFSSRMIETFFEPFFGGVFLERELATSSRYFEFLFRMFSTGTVAVPAAGMQAIPEQLAARLPPGGLLLNHRVTGLIAVEAGFSIAIDSGDPIFARSVVIATEEPESRRLLGAFDSCAAGGAARTWNGTTAFYFAAEDAPVDEPLLILNGEGNSAGPVNNSVVMSKVSATYAPPGAHLISASVVGDVAESEQFRAELEEGVRRHLAKWFGTQVRKWQTLGSTSLARALPLQETANWEQGQSAAGVRNVFVCGDFLETSSIQGSLASGRRAAQALLASQSFDAARTI